MPVLPSLRSRFALTIAILVSVLSWLLGSFISHDSNSRMIDEIGQDLAENAYQMSDRLDRDMASRIHLLSVISRLPVLQQASDTPQIRHLLIHLQEEFPSFAWVGFVAPDGVVKAATQGVLEQADISERPVFQQGREHLFVGDVHDA